MVLFGDLDRPLNVSRGFVELLVTFCFVTFCSRKQTIRYRVMGTTVPECVYSHDRAMCLPIRNS